MTTLRSTFATRFRRIAATAVALVALTALPLAAPTLADEAGPLVTADWLKARLGTPDLLVLDIRSAIDGGGAEAYAKAHIPGAVHSDYDKAGWRVTRNDIPFMLPTVAELEKLIGEIGIDEDVQVVIVPAGVHATDFGSAARVYWTLKLVGHGRVSILDGGFAAWAADKANPVEAGVTKPSARIFTAALDKRALAEVAEVETLQQNGGATLVDARPASFFAGKQKAPAAKAYGHIPGAINIDSHGAYDPATNRLKDKGLLATVFAAVPSGPIVSYCNTGHWAATNWFVLSELLGRKDVRLYGGSMVEWSSASHRPLASDRTKWDDLKRALGFGT